MRRPSIAVDFWALESGEERHASAPESFWIPPRFERETLRPGLAAKLIFQVECEEDGQVVVQTERMWVFVSEVTDDGYIGILDNQPAAYAPGDDIYLVMGAEVPFWPEHVIDIAEPPADYVSWQQSQPPLRTWARA